MGIIPKNFFFEGEKMNSKFTEKAEKALSFAHSSAESYGHTYIGTEHLLLALVHEENSLASLVLSRSGLTKARIDSLMKDFCGHGTKSTLSAEDMTPRLRHSIEAAHDICKKYESRRIGTEHLLAALLEEKESVSMKMLVCLGTDIIGVKDEVYTLLRASDMRARKSDGKEKPKRQNLTKYGKNLTLIAESFDPLIGRDKEIERLIRVLARKTKNNPCLIGEAGVGKTAIVEGLALRIAQRNVPPSLFGKEIISVDLTSMIAGAKYRGDFEERIMAITEEAASDPDVILFIDEIHTIVGAGAAEGAIDAANILKPKLARAEIQLIGATTKSEYRKYIEKDSALERRFQPISVSEPGLEATVEILKGIKSRYEEHHGIVIKDEALSAAVKLAQRYINDRRMPDKAIDLLDEACSKCVLETRSSNIKSKKIGEKLKQIAKEKEEAVCNLDFDRATGLRDLELLYRSELRENEHCGSDGYKAKLDISHVEDVVSELVGARISLSSEDDFGELKDKLLSEIVGQNEAVLSLCEGIVRNKIGITGTDRPLGIFMFVGESGVGKTALATALAASLFGDERFLIRYDMSEFSESSSTSKFIGSSPGYVGYDDGSTVLERVRQSPYSVVLFDEIEKACREVQNLFLQIADYGKITDSHGREVSFKNTYIILTSNAIGGKARGGIGFASNKEDFDKHSALGEYFSTEFLSRIDEVIRFSPIERADLCTITRKVLCELEKRLSRFNLTLFVKDDAVDFIASRGRSKGAVRNILSFIKQHIESKLAMMISRGECEKEDKVELSFSGGELAFNVKKRALS